MDVRSRLSRRSNVVMALLHLGGAGRFADAAREWSDGRRSALDDVGSIPALIAERTLHRASHEFRHADEGDRASAEVALESLLSQAQDKAVLARAMQGPDQLREFLLNDRGLTLRADLLSADAQSYFDELLVRSCEFIAARVQTDDLDGRAERAGISELLVQHERLTKMIAELSQQPGVRSSGPAIVDQLSSSSVFADDLRDLHPWRRAEAEKVAAVWPALMTFVHTLVSTDDRAALLQQWENNPPAPFEAAPAEAWCWLGQIAGELGDGRTASAFIMRGVRCGAYPRNYWIARAALHLDADDSRRVSSLLADAGEPHPLGLAIAAMHRTDFTAATSTLELWQPNAPNDKAIKAAMYAQCLAAEGNLNRAITVALDAATDEDATGVALLAANLLLRRAQSGPSDNPLSDSDAAFALALRVRNSRRTWGGDSAGAALVAVSAAGMRGDLERALEIAQLPPDGDATPVEAQDIRLRREAAVLAAMVGQLDRAHDLAVNADDAFTSFTVEGFNARSKGDRNAASKAFMAAFDAAPDDTARLQTVSAMADLGAELPDLSGLASSYPEQIQELQSLHELTAGGQEKLSIFRARAHESRLLTVRLAEIYSTQGRYADAAQVLDDGATRWNDPRLMRMAADRYLRDANHAAAQRAAEAALALSGPGWVGEFEARVILFEAHEAQGHSDESTRQARRLVALDANDVDARWALIRCLVREGDTPAAWNALTPDGDPVPPRNKDDASTWIALLAMYDTSEHFVSRALSAMERWPDDEELLGRIIAQIYSGLNRMDLTPTQLDLQTLHTATADYVDRFPNSPVFRQYSVGEDDDPLSSIIPVLQRQHEQRAEFADIESKIRNGEYPLGMLTLTTGRSYAEVSITRAGGMVRSHAPHRRDRAQAELRGAINGTVVLDTTTATTLAVLDPAIVAGLNGQFTRLETTDQTYRDALNGQQSLALRSTMTMGWNAELGRPDIHTITEEAAEKLADHARRTCEILTVTRRRPWKMIKRFPSVHGDTAWLAAIDMAAETGSPFWCDDYVLASLASEMGVPTFGTPDLLRHLVTTGQIDTQLAQTAEASLICNYHVDLSFDPDVMTFAATLDSWAPAGAAFALTRPYTWTAGAPVMQFLITALTHQLDKPLYDIRDWIAHAAIGLVRDLDDASAAGNLQILLGRLIAQPWMRPDRFPAALAGVRQGIAERPGTEDPLTPVLTELHKNLVDQHGHVISRQLLLALVKNASDADRHAAVRIILSI